MFRKPPLPRLDGPVQSTSDYLKSQHLKRGGRRKREHHNFGDDVLGFLGKAANTALDTAPMWLPMILKKGGRARRNKK